MIIKRDIHLNRIIARKHNGMIKVITGLRRCGKSYLLFNLFQKHLHESGVDDAHIIKVDLEDRRNQSLRNPDNLLAYIDAKLVDDKMYYVLLDEVQLVPEFEDVLNSFLKVPMRMFTLQAAMQNFSQRMLLQSSGDAVTKYISPR